MSGAYFKPLLSIIRIWKFIKQTLFFCHCCNILIRKCSCSPVCYIFLTNESSSFNTNLYFDNTHFLRFPQQSSFSFVPHIKNPVSFVKFLLGTILTIFCRLCGFHHLQGCRWLNHDLIFTASVCFYKIILHHVWANFGLECCSVNSCKCFTDL